MESLAKAGDAETSQPSMIRFLSATGRASFALLSYRLLAYGISEHLQGLMLSHVADRSFAVKVGNDTSKASPHSGGFSQGSVLGA